MAENHVSNLSPRRTEMISKCPPYIVGFFVVGELSISWQKGETLNCDPVLSRVALVFGSIIGAHLPAEVAHSAVDSALSFLSRMTRDVTMEKGILLE